jgi:sec-independent protein translocase protein TatA
MFEGLFQPMHLVLILAIAVVVFGPKRLPELGRALGSSIRGFKEAVNDDSPRDPGEPKA